MAASFGALSTSDEVLEGVDLSGKRVLITGVSAGIGMETARALIAHCAQVVGGARDLDKARAATEAVRAEAANGGGLELVALDLASLVSVRACADALVADGRPFDVLIANAGLMACPESRTVDGFETQFGVNHLGHFVLINRLVSLLRPGSRVVSVSSRAHRRADVDLDDPNFERTPYEGMLAYGRSKTANVLFAVTFDRCHRAAGVRATAVHPGIIPMSEVARHLSPELLAEWQKAAVSTDAPAGRYKSAAQGAATTLWSGFVAPADVVGGRYYEDCNVAAVVTHRAMVAYALMRSTPSTPRRCGPRARLWWASGSEATRRASPGRSCRLLRNGGEATSTSVAPSLGPAEHPLMEPEDDSCGRN